MLQVNNLCVTYGQVIALDGFSRTISKGSIVVFTGPNGAGKSTVLKTMAGLIQPKTGTVSLDNQDITGLCDPRIGIVLQRPVLFSGTVKHNVEYGLKCHGIPRSQHESLSTAALGKVGASELIHRHRTALSGGEIQRIALARTLALNPDVLLLDEPFSHLDTQGAQALLQTLLELNRSGITLCIATHDIQVAPAMGAEIVTLVHGRETPSVIRNVFRGRSYCAQGIWYVQLSNGQLLEHTQTISGDVAFSVDPDSIIISNAPIKTSARNTLQGKITGLETVSCNEDEIHHEQVQVTIDCGFPMIVNLTSTSVRQLDLRLNTVVYLVFKASALRLCRIRR